MIRLTPAELVAFAERHVLELTEEAAPRTAILAVELAGTTDPAVADAATRAARRLGLVLVGVAPAGLGQHPRALLEALTCTLVMTPAATAATVAVPDVEAALAALDEAVHAHPRAALTLAHVLRATPALDVADALAVESAAYSMLLAGPEFAAWRASGPRRPRPATDAPAVLADRDGATLTITLNRQERHNAFSADVRDGLATALDRALADASLERVVLRGAGASFCSGGDLDEFGTAPDVALAHLIRLDRSVAARVHRLGRRATVVLHGSCIGAGIEIASFAHRIEACADARIQLPELAMGLIPGAGGTVGITRRIGRWRTAYLCLSGETLTPDRALDWGLVDARAEA